MRRRLLLLLLCSFIAPIAGAKNLYPVLVDNRYGYVDERGHMAIAPQFQFAQGFYGELALIKNQGLVGYIDKDGKTVIKPKYTHGTFFANGLAAVSEDGNHYGYIDERGEYVIKPEFFDAHPFTGALAAVTDRKDRSAFFYINRKGERAFEGYYMFAGNFYHGLARVQKIIPELADHDADWKWGYLDEQGRYAIAPSFEKAGDFLDEVTFVFEKGDYYLIDTKGHTVAKSPYGIIFSPSEGLACVYKNRKYGYLNTQGKLAIPLQYEFCDFFNNGAAVVSLGGKYAVVNASGDVIYHGDVPWP